MMVEFYTMTFRLSEKFINQWFPSAVMGALRNGLQKVFCK